MNTNLIILIWIISFNWVRVIHFSFAESIHRFISRNFLPQQGVHVTAMEIILLQTKHSKISEQAVELQPFKHRKERLFYQF